MEDMWIDPYKLLLNNYFINKLQSIESANRFSIEESSENTQKVIDNVIICLYFKEDDNYEEKITNFWDPEYFNFNNKINLLSLFKKFELSFDNINYSEFKHSFPFCKEITFVLKPTDDYEIITNPILYQNGVESLKFRHYFKNTFNLSAKIISNIKEIKPKSVYIHHEFLYEGQLNFIDILSQLPTKMKITFVKDAGYIPISLWFSNTVLKIFQNDRDDFTLFEWKSFKFKIGQKYFKYIKGEHYYKDPNSDWLALDLDYYSQVEFEDFKLISNKEQAAEIDHCFPRWIPDFMGKWTVFILAKDLIEAKLNCWVFSRGADIGAAQWLFSRWSRLKSSIFTFFLFSDSKYITNINNLPPQNIKLSAYITPAMLQL